MKTVIAIDRRGEVIGTGYGSTIEAAENQTRLLLREVIARTNRAWREFTFLYDEERDE